MHDRAGKAGIAVVTGRQHGPVLGLPPLLHGRARLPFPQERPARLGETLASGPTGFKTTRDSDYDVVRNILQEEPSLLAMNE